MHHDGAARDIIERVKKEKNTYMALGGDLIEAICVDDKRFDADSATDPVPIKQAQDVRNLLEPIKHKILFVLTGNHEYALHKYGDLVKYLICEPLGVSYGTYTCKCLVSVGNKPAYKLFYTHGAKSISSIADDPIRREANMKLSLKQRLKHKAADCEVMAMGHTHKLIVSGPEQSLYLTDDGKKIRQHYTAPGDGEYIHPDHRWYVNTGSLMKLYVPGISGYAERFGYDPCELGHAEIIVRNGKITNIEKRVIN